MKVMTFNIQHGVVYDDPQKKIDLHAFAEYIKEENPDILALNEVRAAQDESLLDGDVNDYNAPQAKLLASFTGMNCFFAPAIKDNKNGLYGNALLTRFEIGECDIFPIPSPPQEKRIFSRYENRCLLRSVVHCGDEDVTVFVCHMGLNPQERLTALEIVCRELDRTEGKKILMGDFNMTSDNELMLPIYERLEDVAVKIKGELATFPSFAPERKIDYIFVSKDFDIISAEIPDKYISDHKVHTAQIK